MRRRRRGRTGLNIDITPLIDVLFMLIIFFVLTTAFVQGSIVIELPGGDPPPPDTRRSPIVVTVTAGSEILWAGEPISRDAVPARVADALARSEDILVAGDRKAPYGDVAELLEELRGLGVADVGLLFESDG